MCRGARGGLLRVRPELSFPEGHYCPYLCEKQRCRQTIKYVIFINRLISNFFFISSRGPSLITNITMMNVVCHADVEVARMCVRACVRACVLLINAVAHIYSPLMICLCVRHNVNASDVWDLYKTTTHKVL